MKLAIDDIEATEKTQTRAALNKAVVREYAELIKEGTVLPPIVCFAEKASERFVLADGFHRLHGAVDAGKKEIEVTVKPGKVRDAIIYGLNANAHHGIRRTDADKRTAVTWVLKDAELSQQSYRKIAEQCGVSHTFVRLIKQELVTKKQRKQKGGGNISTPGKGDFRQSRPAPTQAEVDRDELRTALVTIRSFPYPGSDAAKLHLTKSDLRDCALASDWLAEAAGS